MVSFLGNDSLPFCPRSCFCCPSPQIPRGSLAPRTLGRLSYATHQRDAYMRVSEIFHVTTASL
eukprot:9498942-Pyramimonas_sp.AAC.1